MRDLRRGAQTKGAISRSMSQAGHRIHMRIRMKPSKYNKGPRRDALGDALAIFEHDVLHQRHVVIEHILANQTGAFQKRTAPY
jgi:hypothetical protein